jgi:hypothetical protein
LVNGDEVNTGDEEIKEKKENDIHEIHEIQ